jgi:hypothetical protein
VLRIVIKGMSEGMDQSPTCPLRSRFASRPQERLFNNEVTPGISLNLPHQDVSFRDGLCDTVETLKFRSDFSKDLLRRPRWPCGGAAKHRQKQAQRR